MRRMSLRDKSRLDKNPSKQSWGCVLQTQVQKDLCLKTNLQALKAGLRTNPKFTKKYIISLYKHFVKRNIRNMNNKNREEKLGFIFETGRALRFYMDYAVGAIEPEASPGHGDLSVIQMKAAMEIWLYQPMNLGELARRLKVGPSSASALVDKLVEKEVVTREPDPEDRRRVVLCIHPRAAEAMIDCNRRFHEAFSAIAGQVGDENVDKWYDVMTQIHKILEEEVKNG